MGAKGKERERERKRERGERVRKGERKTIGTVWREGEKRREGRWDRRELSRLGEAFLFVWTDARAHL